MRNLFLPILFFGFSSFAMGQSDQTESRALQISAELGIDGLSSNSLFSYLNTLYGTSASQRLNGFIPATEFVLAPAYPLNDHLLLGVEYGFLSCSKSINGFYEGEFTETIHMPMVLIHYYLHGGGYWLKFGSGAGYYIGSLAQTIVQGSAGQTYTAHGFGMKLDAVMNLAFDEHLYGVLSGNMRWCAGGAFASDGMDAAYQSVTPRLNFVTVGLNLGMMYQF
jgi:hypothetical protein